MRSKSSADYALESLEARVLLAADPVMTGVDYDLFAEVEQVEVAEMEEPIATAVDSDSSGDLNSLLDDATLAGAELLGSGANESLDQSVSTTGEGGWGAQANLPAVGLHGASNDWVISADVSGDTVTIAGWDSGSKNVSGAENYDAEVYLRTNSGLLEWSDDGNSWSSDLDGNTFTISAHSAIVIDGSQLGTVHFDGDFHAGGADLKVEVFDRIDIADATISTREISDLSGGDHEADASTGNSGDLTLKATTITATNAKLLSQVEEESAFTAGDVTLEADEQYDVLNTIYPFFDGRFTEATVTL